MFPPSDVTFRGLLLGTRGWQRPDWIEDYYPQDMPSGWRLAYYANDADCVLLPASIWADPDPELDEQLDEAPDRLVFFLEAALVPAAYEAIERRFRGRPAVVLGTGEPVPAGIPNWHPDPNGGWLDPDSNRRLRCVELAQFDLRALRQQVEGLPPETVALVLEGQAASPGQLTETRMLVELLGRG